MHSDLSALPVDRLPQCGQERLTPGGFEQVMVAERRQQLEPRLTPVDLLPRELTGSYVREAGGAQRRRRLVVRARPAVRPVAGIVPAGARSELRRHPGVDLVERRRLVGGHRVDIPEQRHRPEPAQHTESLGRASLRVDKIKLLSTADTGFFYVTSKNSRTKTDKLSFRKYDPVAKKHVEFKETKIK